MSDLEFIGAIVVYIVFAVMFVIALYFVLWVAYSLVELIRKIWRRWH